MRFPAIFVLMCLTACGADDAVKGGNSQDSSADNGASSDNGGDDDCAGDLWYLDADGDGYGEAAGTPFDACNTLPLGYVQDATDCDDDNPAVNPSADEVCDELGVDENCNGVSNADDPDTIDLAEYVPDADGDGYGDERGVLESSCDIPSGRVSNLEDCDDTDPSVYPGASETGAGLLEDPSCAGGVGSLADADVVFLDDANSNPYTIKSAGDVDGDGLDDLLLGVRRGNLETGPPGGAKLIFGSTLVASGASQFELDAADVEFMEEEAHDGAGSSVSGAGDLDGDGLDDLIIGADGNVINGGGGAGKVHIILASSLMEATSSLINLGDADYTLTGTAGDAAGFSVDTAGDVDGDGLGDIIIGAYCDTSCTGAAWLVFGRTLAASTSGHIELQEAGIKLVGDRPIDGAARSVSGAGDVDGDGLSDLLIGGPETGAPSLFLGSTLTALSASVVSLSDADVTFSVDGNCSSTVRRAGDVDGDGLDDILLVCDAYPAVFLFRGSSVTSSSSRVIDLFDADLLLYGPGADAPTEHTGSSYNESDREPGAISTAGDLDGDGLADIVLGSHSNADNGEDAGKAHVVLGRTLANYSARNLILRDDGDFELVGEDEGQRTGVHVSNAGDVNGDGMDDLVIGTEFGVKKGYFVFGTP